MEDVTDLCRRVPDETFVRNVEYHEELASTNDRALELAGDPAAGLPALVVADRQTAGRGRGGNQWWSAEGALTLSLIVDEDTAGFPLKGGQIALRAGLAVAQSLERLLPPTTIGLKWPNDVLVRERKICGILTELPSSRGDVAVVGIGVNVNNSRNDAPADLQETVTSLRDETGTTVSRIDLLVALLVAMECELKRHRAKPGRLPRDWERLCVLTGHSIAVEQSGVETTGTCRGIRADGALQLETPSGITAVHSTTSIRRTNRIKR